MSENVYVNCVSAWEKVLSYYIINKLVLEFLRTMHLKFLMYMLLSSESQYLLNVAHVVDVLLSMKLENIGRLTNQRRKQSSMLSSQQDVALLQGRISSVQWVHRRPYRIFERRMQSSKRCCVTVPNSQYIVQGTSNIASKFSISKVRAWNSNFSCRTCTVEEDHSLRYHVSFVLLKH